MTTTNDVGLDVHYKTDDVRILEIKELAAPSEILAEFRKLDEVRKQSDGPPARTSIE